MLFVLNYINLQLESLQKYKNYCNGLGEESYNKMKMKE